MRILAPLGARLIKILLALGLAYLYWWNGEDVDSGMVSNLAMTMAGVSGTLLGFLLTAITLLTAVMDRTLILNMRITGHYQKLVKESFFTCGVLLVTLITCICILVLKFNSFPLLITLLVFQSTLSFLFVFTAGRRFYNVFVTLS